MGFSMLGATCEKDHYDLGTDVDHILREMSLPRHFRPRQHAAVWHSPMHGWRDHLMASLSACESNPIPSVYFRADDIGAGGRAFRALCQIFRSHGVPLALSVVPAWLSDVRGKQLFEAAPLEEPLWGWHQHGWRHVNWERSGKKSEFGEQRPLEKQWKDIWQGQNKMRGIFNDHLVNVFTPPWNRLSNSTLRILQELGFEGVSLEKVFPRGLRPPLSLKNLRVTVDLHTRKARDAQQDFFDISDELTGSLSKREPVGVMLHHQRMTYFAFEYLDELLRILRTTLKAQFLSFKDILHQENNEQACSSLR